MMSNLRSSLCMNASALTVGALLVLSPTSVSTYTNQNIPIVQTKVIVEESSTPKLITGNSFLSSPNISIESRAKYDKKSILDDAMELFPGIRSFTKEEKIEYEQHLSKLSVETGENFFDLL